MLKPPQYHKKLVVEIYSLSISEGVQNSVMEVIFNKCGCWLFRDQHKEWLSFITQQFESGPGRPEILAVNLPTTTPRNIRPAVSLSCIQSVSIVVMWPLAQCITALPSALLYSHLQVKPWNTSRISWHWGTITTRLIKINTWKTVCGGSKTD